MKPDRKAGGASKAVPAVSKRGVRVPEATAAKRVQHVSPKPQASHPELSWDRLLNQERFRPSPKDAIDHRSEFERDFDRVIFSSSFRRLQDKTQVWPLEAHDFVRTRLTHSCEVATIGRSLALGVFGECRSLHSIDVHYPAAAVATACLLHDIGNPPFGHTGEEHISDWFKRLFSRERSLRLTDVEKLDLQEFEGNAHALRVATQLQTLGKPHGMNLTFGTLSTLMKYPWSSIDAPPPKPRKKRKFGFFASEAETFAQVRRATGLHGDVRHPLAHLVEAADDIAYSVIDIEDGFKKRAFSYEHFVVEAAKIPAVGEFIEQYLVKAAADLATNGTTPEVQQLAFQQFRVFAIGRLTGSVVRTYVDNYGRILSGEVRGDLVKSCDLSSLVKFLKDFAFEYVYTAPEVVKTERAAKHVIDGLLDILWEESGNPESKLMKVLVGNISVDLSTCSPDYVRCQRLADYVAGMTDTFAFDLYHRLSGT